MQGSHIRALTTRQPVVLCVYVPASNQEDDLLVAREEIRQIRHAAARVNDMLEVVPPEHFFGFPKEATIKQQQQTLTKLAAGYYSGFKLAGGGISPYARELIRVAAERDKISWDFRLYLHPDLGTLLQRYAKLFWRIS